jgi:hypothetical protein
MPRKSVPSCKEPLIQDQSMTEKVQDTVEEIKKDEIVETDEVVEKENQEEDK